MVRWRQTLVDKGLNEHPRFRIEQGDLAACATDSNSVSIVYKCCWRSVVQPRNIAGAREDMRGRNVVDSKALRHVGDERLTLIRREDHPTASRSGQMGIWVKRVNQHRRVNRYVR